MVGKQITPEVLGALEHLVGAADASVLDLLETMQIVSHAAQARQGTQASEALSVLFLQFMSVFGYSKEIFAHYFPTLESIKIGLGDGAFDEALPKIRRCEELLQEIDSFLSSATLTKTAIRGVSSDKAAEFFIEALIRVHRANWFVPGPMKIARADHFGELLRNFDAWYRSVTGSQASGLHLAVVAEVMLGFPRRDDRSGMNPWVLDEDFPIIRRDADARVSEPSKAG